MKQHNKPFFYKQKEITLKYYITRRNYLASLVIRVNNILNSVLRST